jgi:hypothetical protein
MFEAVKMNFEISYPCDDPEYLMSFAKYIMTLAEESIKLKEKEEARKHARTKKTKTKGDKIKSLQEQIKYNKISLDEYTEELENDEKELAELLKTPTKK